MAFSFEPHEGAVQCSMVGVEMSLSHSSEHAGLVPLLSTYPWVAVKKICLLVDYAKF